MSAYTYRAPSSTRYEILLDNCKIERESTDSVSTCSEWTSTFDLNLDPILFLRSSNAQLGVSHFTLSELPLALTSDDSLDIWLESDLNSLMPNRIFNQLTVGQLNKTVFNVKLQNVTAANCSTLVSYLNEKLACIQVFLMYRYSLIFFDKQIWHKNLFEHLQCYTAWKNLPKEWVGS